jgi:hypothetical protein
VPIVAGKLILLKKSTGIVGGVAHAKADCTTPVAKTSFGSSGKKSTGVVGVMPISAGLPIPIVVAVAAARKSPISRIFTRPGVAPVLISKHGVASTPLEVLAANDTIISFSLF